MTTAVQAVVDARETLQRAETAEREERVKTARKQLRELRQLAKQLRREYLEIAERVSSGDRTVFAKRDQLMKIDGEISNVRANHKRDVLADDDELEREITALQRKRAKVMSELLEGQELTTDRHRGIEIAGQLHQMEFEAQNLETIIENQGRIRPARWEGGISTVR